MAKIDLIKLESKDWIKFRFDLKKEFDLSDTDVVLYGYIFRHCSTYHPGESNYWLGYSNERIADDCNMSLATLKRSLKTLVDKKLIIIANPGKRTKQANQSRMIYINDEIYIREDQASIEDIEIESLRRQVAELQDKLHKAEIENEVYPNKFLQQIIDAGLIPDKDIKRACKVLNVAYETFARQFSYEEMQKHLSYVIRELKGKYFGPRSTIENDAVRYLSAALDQRFQQLHARDADRRLGRVEE